MTVITLLDHKNEYIQLTILPMYRTSERGLTEMRALVQIPSMPEYQQIPLPVFTQWWIQ